MKSISQFADELTKLVERSRRLPPPMGGRPTAFHEAKDELANDLRKLRDELVVAHGDRKPSFVRRPTEDERVVMAEGTITAEKGNRVVVTFRNRRRAA